VPVAVAVMTPFPLLGIYLYKRICAPKMNEASASESERIV